MEFKKNDINEVKIIGNVTKDVEIKVIEASGVKYANFTVAVNNGHYEKGADGQIKTDESGKKIWVQDPTDFIPVTAYGQMAEYYAGTLKKGDSISVDGHLKENNYETREGQKVYSFSVIPTNIIKNPDGEIPKSVASVLIEGNVSGVKVNELDGRKTAILRFANNRSTEKSSSVNWVSVLAGGKLAEKCKGLKQGQLVKVEGTLKMKTAENSYGLYVKPWDIIPGPEKKQEIGKKSKQKSDDMEMCF